jgi:hypothetical protein
MNGWLRLETEQRGSWLRQRVQDLRAAQVARQAESTVEPPTRMAAQRRPAADLGCAEAA